MTKTYVHKDSTPDHSYNSQSLVLFVHSECHLKQLHIHFSCIVIRVIKKIPEPTSRFFEYVFTFMNSQAGPGW